MSTATRSQVMSKIRGSGNRTTEWRLRGLLVRLGIKGWRLGTSSALPGRPDFIFESRRLIIFLDGCFWHGCPRCYRAPTSNQPYWRKKIKTNRARDRRVSSALRRQGWRVWRVWECRLQNGPQILFRKICNLDQKFKKIF